MTRRIDENIEREICRRYPTDGSLALSKELNIDQGTVGRVLKRNGIVVKSSADIQRKITNQIGNEVIQRYSRGESTDKIGKSFEISSNAINVYLRKNGIEIKKRKDESYKDICNHNVFSILTPEACYWLGWMATDGCVTNDRVELRLSEIDKDHIEKFKKFLGTRNKITFHKGREAFNSGHISKPLYGIAVTSKKMIEDLSKYGIVKNKSLTMKISDELKMNKKFWLGVIEGDGSVGINCSAKKRSYGMYKYYYSHLQLCGSLFLMEQFLDFVKTIIPDCKTRVHKSKNIYAVSLTCDNANKVIKFLYENASVYLNRKYEKAIQILDIYREKTGKMIGGI